MGAEFSGEGSSSLEESMRQQSLMYFKNYHRYVYMYVRMYVYVYVYVHTVHTKLKFQF